MRVLQTLRNFELFAKLSDTALHCIADVIVPRTYAPDTLIVVEGEPCDAAYFVVSGEVQVYRMSSQGRQQVLIRLEPGQSFNVVPIFESHGENRASAVALSDVTLFAVLKDDFLRVIRTCPDLAMVILHDFADRLTHLTNLVEDLALRSVRGRLARFLLQQANGRQITQRWTQDEIAAHLGTVRDMVGRSLRSLTDAGLIRLDRGRIVLQDRDALETEAES